jgi:hypothetical protein
VTGRHVTQPALAYEVIALHHSGVPRTDPEGEFLDQSGNVGIK